MPEIGCSYQQSKLNDITVNDIITEISTSDKDKIDDIENAIQSLQAQMHSIDKIIRIDSEATDKIKNQVHVLSAKYTDFNKKMCKFLVEYNRRNTEQINVNQIIDADTIPYIEYDQRCNGPNVAFNMSLSNNYLNEIKFPTNWTFFDQHTHPSNTAMKKATHIRSI